MEPCDLTLREAQRRLHESTLSPQELLDSCLKRIEETEPQLRAWVLLDDRGAQMQVEKLDSDRRGPLWGIPVGIKDIIDVEGLPTTASSRVLRNNVASEDAPIVRRLREAGAIILGKTNTQEFAYGVVTAPTTNPWDQHRIPGGSSGGSAAALATSHCLAALGTDTAGSIRIPAALCGITGIKPRPGLLPMQGIIPLAPSFDVVGPMARTVEDLVLLWDVLTGSGSEVPASPPPFKVAVAHQNSLPDLDAEVRASFEKAVETMRPLAKDVSSLEFVPFDQFDTPRSYVLLQEALEVHRSRGWWPNQSGDYSEETRSYHEFAEAWGSEELDREYGRQLEDLKRAFLGFLEIADILLTPTVPRPAPSHKDAARVDEGSPRRPAVVDLTRIPGPVNVAALAAVSVPCGFTESGLPVGLQLVGQDENLLLAVALAFERQGQRSQRRPSLVPAT